MGHSEMSLAVAGLKQDEIAARTKKLATGDWSDFPPHERQGYQFAHALSRDPAKIGKADLQALLKTWGPERTVDLIWYVAWCNYMTRFADAFQMPLERTNVFMPPKKLAPPEK